MCNLIYVLCTCVFYGLNSNTDFLNCTQGVPQFIQRERVISSIFKQHANEKGMHHTAELLQWPNIHREMTTE